MMIWVQISLVSWIFGYFYQFTGKQDNVLGAFLLGFRTSSNLSQNEDILTNGVSRELTPEIIKIEIMKFTNFFEKL